MAYIDFQLARQQFSVREVLSLLGWRPAYGSPGGHRGRCPLKDHRGHATRSFAWHDQAWYCHQCRRGGDVFDLWAAAKGVQPYKAALELAAIFGRTLTLRRTSTSALGAAPARNGEEER